MPRNIVASRKPAAATSAKPVTSKPVKQAAKPETAKPAPAAPAVESKPAKPSGNVTRTAATIAKQATNFGGLSDRDEAYFSFYKRLIAANGGKLTVAQIAASGQRPAYSGSNKPHDAGVIVRLTKAGLLDTATDGTGFKLTPAGTAHKA